MLSRAELEAEIAVTEQEVLRGSGPEIDLRPRSLPRANVSLFRDWSNKGDGQRAWRVRTRVIGRGEDTCGDDLAPIPA